MTGHKNAKRELMDRDARNAEAKRRFFERIRKARDRGTAGRVTWTREELHER